MPGVTGRGKVPPGDGAVSQWRAQALWGLDQRRPAQTLRLRDARRKRSPAVAGAAWRSAVTAPARPHGGADISKRGVCTGQEPYRTEGPGDST